MKDKLFKEPKAGVDMRIVLSLEGKEQKDIHLLMRHLKCNNWEIIHE